MIFIQEDTMLNATKLGIAGGIVWGVSMLIFTLLSFYTGYAQPFLVLMASVYPGYTISLWGSIIGLIYGFIDAFIGFFLLAWIYNKLKW
jgi:hypothetical protein